MAISTSKRWSAALLTLATAFVLCGGPEFALAQNPDAQQQPTSGSAQPATNSQGDTQNTQTAQPTDQNTQNNAQQNNAQPPDTQNQQSQSEQAVQQQQQSRPGIIDPSKGPLTPAPTANQDEQQPTTEPQNLPDAPSSTQGAQPQPQSETPAQKPRPRTTQPVGVGTAQQAPTAGGAASKPAGAAIAPAKQRQYRSLLIKIGAIAAGGAALGTVYALSRGTKSTPPGAGR